MLEEQYTNHAGFQGLKGADDGGASADVGAGVSENLVGAYDLRISPPGCSIVGRRNAAHQELEASQFAEGIWHVLPPAASLSSHHSFSFQPGLQI